MSRRYELVDDSVVVVIGSGAGGGTVSNELTQKGVDVVCLEAGSRLSLADVVNDSSAMDQKMGWHDKRLGAPVWRLWACLADHNCRTIRQSSPRPASHVPATRARPRLPAPVRGDPQPNSRPASKSLPSRGCRGSLANSRPSGVICADAPVGALCAARSVAPSARSRTPASRSSAAPPAPPRSSSPARSPAPTAPTAARRCKKNRSPRATKRGCPSMAFCPSPSRATTPATIWKSGSSRAGSHRATSPAANSKAASKASTSPTGRTTA